jgi:nucleotide-binding universal stress UspA family protein
LVNPIFIIFSQVYYSLTAFKATSLYTPVSPRVSNEIPLMKKILYPTDFSDTAENAFLYALQLADTLGASVITLHAFDRPDISNFNLPGILRDVYDSIDLDEFENYEDEIPLLRDLATDNGYYHVPMVHVLEEGAPVSAILRTANKNKADLIVMGATGAGRMESFFFGTISGKVLEEAHCPVIVVPAEAKFDGLIDHIAVAVNFKPEDALLIEQLRKFRDQIGSQIHIIHIDTETAESSQEKMKTFCEAWPNDKRISSYCLQHKDVNAGLQTFIKEKNMDLLAMLSHKRTWMDELFHQNRAKSLTFAHSVPLMVFQTENLTHA